MLSPLHYPCSPILISLCSSKKNPHPPIGRSLEIPRGRGVLKAKVLEAKYEPKLEFPGGRGCKTKNLPWGEYGYFLELHILWSCYWMMIIAVTFFAAADRHQVLFLHILAFSILSHVLLHWSIPIYCRCQVGYEEQPSHMGIIYLIMSYLHCM